MALHLAANEPCRSRVQQKALALTLVALLAPVGSTVSAQQRQAARDASDISLSFGSPADLERAFWVCDYAGTHLGVDPGTGAACVAITDALKQSKFNGDFDALLAWWRTHKPAQHRALATAMRESAAR